MEKEGESMWRKRNGKKRIEETGRERRKDRNRRKGGKKEEGYANGIRGVREEKRKPNEEEDEEE